MCFAPSFYRLKPRAPGSFLSQSSHLPFFVATTTAIFYMYPQSTTIARRPQMSFYHDPPSAFVSSLSDSYPHSYQCCPAFRSFSDQHEQFIRDVLNKHERSLAVQDNTFRQRTTSPRECSLKRPKDPN